jgi:AmmeMemoRadiSam system protein A/AmmeMemoRadiSam system protein B
MTILSGYLMPHPPIVISAVGRDQSKIVDATAKAMDDIGRQIAELAPEVIVVISPHGPLFSDAIAIRGEKTLEGHLGSFGASEVHIKKQNALELVEALAAMAVENNIPAVVFDHTLARRFDVSGDLDHGVIVPLSFVENHYQNYKLIEITYGLLPTDELYRFGQMLTACIEKQGLRAVIIASGDLSHKLKDSGPYRYDARGPEFDAWVIEAFRDNDLVKVVTADEAMCEGAGECGKKSLDIMIGALDGLEVRTRVLSYEGPFGVGYGVVALTEPQPSEQAKRFDEIVMKVQNKRENRRSREDSYVKLARAAIESYVRQQKRIKLPEALKQTALGGPSKGVFVSIKSSGGLRGCIGTTIGTQSSLGEEIIHNAIQAATEDPRFPEIEPWELEQLTISVDVLSKGELVSGIEALDPKKYGVIVESDYRRGLLLPDLEGVDSAEEQVRIALNKAGIKEKDAFRIHRFTVERHT